VVAPNRAALHSGDTKSDLKKWAALSDKMHRREIREGIEVKLLASPEGAVTFILCRSNMADQELDLRFARDHLGHESLTTTSGYLPSKDGERHRQTEQKHRMEL